MYGLDTIGSGATIAFAMECFEKGLLTRADTDGLDLYFGNADAMLLLIERIASRAGVCDLLAEGARRAAQQVGRCAERVAVGIDARDGIDVLYHWAIEPQVERDSAAHEVGPHELQDRLHDLVERQRLPLRSAALQHPAQAPDDLPRALVGVDDVAQDRPHLIEIWARALQHQLRRLGIAHHRHALHAHLLAFRHPLNGKKISYDFLGGIVGF